MSDKKNKSETILRTVADVHKYLENHDWKISKTQLYEHVDQKKLKRSNEGIFSMSAVSRYALKYLRMADGSKPSKALADIQERKYEADTRQAVANAEMKELKISILKGEYVPKDSFEIALAQRAMIFKADIETFCRAKAPDIISLVTGDFEPLLAQRAKDKIPDLIEYMLAESAGWLNRYAADREFIVPAAASESILQDLNDAKDDEDDPDDPDSQPED